MEDVDTTATVMDGETPNRARMSHRTLKHPTQSRTERRRTTGQSPTPPPQTTSTAAVTTVVRAMAKAVEVPVMDPAPSVERAANASTAMALTPDHGATTTTPTITPECSAAADEALTTEAATADPHSTAKASPSTSSATSESQ